MTDKQDDTRLERFLKRLHKVPDPILMVIELIVIINFCSEIGDWLYLHPTINYVVALLVLNLSYWFVISPAIWEHYRTLKERS